MDATTTISIMVISCTKTWDRLKSLLWVQKIDDLEKLFPHVKFNFILGSSENTFINNPRIIYTSCGDYYEDLPAKIVSGIKTIKNKYPEVKKILKIDDDVEADMKQLLTYIDSLSNDIKYGGNVVNLNYSHNSNYHQDKCYNKELNSRSFYIPPCVYSGGPCYYLAEEAIELINSIQEIPNVSKNIMYEDTFIGSFLNSKGIFPAVLKLYSDNFQDLLDNKVVAWHNRDRRKIKEEEIQSLNRNSIINSSC